MAEIAKGQFMTKGGLTGLIDELEGRGLVRRSRSKQDRRVINIEITNPGLRLLQEGELQYRRFVRKSLEDLSQEEIESLLKILNKMISSVQVEEE